MEFRSEMDLKKISYKFRPENFSCIVLQDEIHPSYTVKNFTDGFRPKKVFKNFEVFFYF